uniref:Uncharacterized protein n=1 Tax=Helianthus annuus TaxID=4232 RepID=A0A251TZF4_HELAN
MKPIRLLEPPGSPPRGVPDIFEGGVYGVVKCVVIIGKESGSSSGQAGGDTRLKVSR